ncbi:hypothetical protein SLOPH_885 [Spraguea lophii 42_110]|uniref:Chromo domain-containing protein n=1 Tax=Spraguea lophii (strain 42_110) TaxID=1358809 RepID=S7WBF3_SPRLO|nr:hypothetical protein SLOPH_885 [Spraguea lophii 42_110]
MKSNIKKISGYTEFQNEPYVFVVWEDRTATWEKINSINAPILLINFLSKVDEKFNLFEKQQSLKIKKENQKNFISSLMSKRNIIKSKAEVERNKTLEGIKLMRKKYDPTESDISKSTREDSKKLNKKFDKKFKEEKIKNKKNDMNLVTIKDFKKNIKQMNKNEFIEIKNTKIQLGYNLLVNNENVGMFTILPLFYESEFPKLEFHVQFTISFLEVKTILISYWQGLLEGIQFYSLVESNIKDNFRSLALQLKEEGNCLVDNTGTIIYILVPKIPQFEIYNLDSQYSLICIKKELFNLHCDINFQKYEKNTINYSNTDIYELYKNKLFYNLPENIESYGLFMDNLNPNEKDLVCYLNNLGYVQKDLSCKDISCIIISVEYLQYIHRIPNFKHFIENNTRFFIFDIKKNTVLTEIFISGGIITVTEKLIKTLDTMEVIQILKSIQTDDGKWKLKVPSYLVENYKKYLEENNKKIRFTEMVEIFNILKNSVEDFTNDTEDNKIHFLKDFNTNLYLKRLQSKHFISKRHFLAMCVDETKKTSTPEQIFSKYFKKSSL